MNIRYIIDRYLNMRCASSWLVSLIFVGASALLLAVGATSVGDLAFKLVAVYLLCWSLYALLSEEPSYDIRIRLLLFSGAAAFVVCCLEFMALANIIDYRQIFPPYHAVSTLQHPGYEYDPNLLWVRKPHVHLVGTYTKGNEAAYFCLPHQAQRAYELQYDQNGFRNTADLGQADIVLIGDSYIEAPILKHQHTVASHLAGLQKKTVANLGMSGYGPSQELYALTRFALPLRPQVVVWAFFEGNDILDIEEYDTTVASFRSQPPFLVNFWFRSLTRNVLSTLLYEKQRCAGASAIEEHTGIFVDNYGQSLPVYFMPRRSLRQEDEPKITRAFQLVSEAARLSLQQGARHVVVFVPIKDRVLQGLPNAVISQWSQKQSLDDLPQRLGSFLSKEVPGAEFLDLTPVLRRAAASGLLPYFADDTHWNEEGHRLAAEAIHQHLSVRMAGYR
jgi:hypothetical protein